MNQSNYSSFKPSQLILRDHLALERTAMANERTLLAYVRTMIGLIAVGGTFIKLFSGLLPLISGWLLIFLGISTLVFGFLRYVHIHTTIFKVTNPSSEFGTSDPMHKTVLQFLKITSIYK